MKTPSTQNDWVYRETWVDVTAQAICDHEAASSWGGNDPAHSDKYHRAMAKRVIEAQIAAGIMQAGLDD